MSAISLMGQQNILSAAKGHVGTVAEHTIPPSLIAKWRPARRACSQAHLDQNTGQLHWNLIISKKAASHPGHEPTRKQNLLLSSIKSSKPILLIKFSWLPWGAFLQNTYSPFKTHIGNVSRNRWLTLMNSFLSLLISSSSSSQSRWWGSENPLCRPSFKSNFENSGNNTGQELLQF